MKNCIKQCVRPHRLEMVNYRYGLYAWVSWVHFGNQVVWESMSVNSVHTRFIHSLRHVTKFMCVSVIHMQIKSCIAYRHLVLLLLCWRPDWCLVILLKSNGFYSNSLSYYILCCLLWVNCFVYQNIEWWMSMNSIVPCMFTNQLV